MRKSDANGFSLVEVAMALGVAAFCLVAVMGLLTVSVGTSHLAQNDTVLTIMTSSLMGELRRESFDKLSASSVYYFDVEGLLQRDDDAKPIANPVVKSIYRCNVKLTECKEASTLSPIPPGRNSANLYWAKLDFGWPVLPGSTATTVLPNNRAIYASIPRR